MRGSVGDPAGEVVPALRGQIGHEMNVLPRSPGGVSHTQHERYL
jgi:hypothetical protein